MILQAAAVLATACLVALVIWRLPVNGWGSLVWLGGTFAMVLIRQPFASRTKGNTIVEERMDLTERVLLGAMALAGTLLPLLYLATGLLAFADYTLPAAATWVGAAVLIPALVLFWRSHADLDRNWSVSLELREQHGLVTDGVYRYCRHPMYAAIWLIVLVQPLLLQNWIAGPGSIFVFGILFQRRMSTEEAMMRDHFGAEYDVYCQRTRRIWPVPKRQPT